MSWATAYIKALSKGETVTMTPQGKSMEPIVMDGQEVTVAPVDDPRTLEVGEVVLCTVRGTDYLHKILAKDRRGVKLSIGNNKGGVNGWIDPVYVHGKMVKT